jgi:hypothetical protein
MVTMDQDNFSNVSWHSEGNEAQGRGDSGAPAPPYGEHTTSASLHDGKQTEAGGDGEDPTMRDPGLTGDILECTVTEPHKESDGTKDAFVSYLITTNVSYSPPPTITKTAAAQLTMSLHHPVYLPFLPETSIYRSSALHRLPLPLQDALQRLPGMRGAASPGQAADGVR